MDSIALVATISTSQAAKAIRRVPEAVSWLQVRADLVGDIPAEWLRAHFAGKLLYTFRRAAADGKVLSFDSERRQRLLAAAKAYDLVELEADGDLDPVLLDAIPPAKRMIAWRGKPCDLSQLQSCFSRLVEVPARLYSMLPAAIKTSDGLEPLLFLKALKRKDVVAYSVGPAGLWSRLLAPIFGSPLIFGNACNSAHQLGELDIQHLIADYGFPTVRPVRELYGMVGTKIFQSPSPRLHNTAYRILNHPALFLPFHVEDFEDFWKQMVESRALEILGVGIRGLVIVSPHKEAVLRVAGACSSMVRRTGASNVFVRRGGVWEAETTDPETISGIKDICPLKAAVIGCGGAGRAVAAALQQTGSDVTLVNRGLRRGAYAVQLLGLPFVPLSEFRVDGFNLIVNATPVGKENEGFPFVIDGLTNSTVVIDLAYGSQPTPLVSAVLARGGAAIDGYDVLLTQVRKQFHLMTGLEIPEIIDRETVLAGKTANFCSAPLLQAAR
ncbi:MAG TPA: type I 3-dehydroquinate dehydratase [Candidatus Angelobacter sp.]